MKRLIFVIAVLALSVVAVNSLIKPKNVVERAEEAWLSDEIETSQAKSLEVNK